MVRVWRMPAVSRAWMRSSGRAVVLLKQTRWCYVLVGLVCGLRASLLAGTAQDGNLNILFRANPKAIDDNV
jgi:hypothetical protein